MPADSKLNIQYNCYSIIGSIIIYVIRSIIVYSAHKFTEVNDVLVIGNKRANSGLYFAQKTCFVPGSNKQIQM
jgi:hypothetical protein